MRTASCFLLLVSVASLGCRSRTTGLVKVDPALEKLVPHDTVMLAGVRMDAVRAAPVYQKWVANRQSRELDKFVRETGLDPRTDLAELLVASNGKHTVILAKGKFSPSELESKLERPGVKKMPHKEYTLIGTEEAAVVFLNSKTAAAGPPPALRAMIDGRDGSRGGIPGPLREKIKSIATEHQIWAAAYGTSPEMAKAIPESGNLANLRRILGSIQSSTAAIDLRSGLKMEASSVCQTEQDAKLIHDALRGLVGMGRLMTPENEPELLRLYDGIQIQQDLDSVRVLAEIPMELLDKFLEKMEARGAV
jgi:hypothetical protein